MPHYVSINITSNTVNSERRFLLETRNTLKKKTKVAKSVKVPKLGIHIIFSYFSPKRKTKKKRVVCNH